MKRFSNFVIYAALTVVLMILSWTFIANIFVSRPMWGFDYPYFEKEDFLVPFSIVLSVMIYFIIVIILYKLLSKFNHNKIKKTICIIGCFLCLLTVFLIPVAPYADQAAMVGIANNILNGNFIDFAKNEYLSLYPFNTGYVMFLIPFAYVANLFSINAGVLVKIANVVFTTLTGYYLAKIFENYFKEKAKYSILLLIIFFTSISILTMNNLVYGDIPGIFFFILSIYFFMKENDNKTRDYILSFVFCAIGNIFRNIGLILLIALILHLLATSKTKYKHLAFSLVGFVFVYFGFSLLQSVLFSKSFPYGSDGMPVFSWIQMGFSGEVGYWVGYEILDIWKSDAYTNQEKVQMYIDNIVSLLKEMKLEGFIELMSRKMHYLFGEGTFQIILYGLGEEETILYNGYGAWYYQTFMTDLLKNGSPLKNNLVDYAYTWNMFAMILSVISILKNIKKKNIMITFFAGLIAFYCLWEIKARYIFTLLPIYIFLITDVLSSVLEIKLFNKKANV